MRAIPGPVDFRLAELRHENAMHPNRLERQGFQQSKTRRVWSPKLWLGMDFFGWLRLLIHHRFAIGLGYLHWVALISIFAVRNTLLRYLQELIWGRRVRDTKIEHAPLFIVGHWRSGTTMLHELLTLDQHHTYPTTYECVFPNHFLLTEWYFTRLSRFVLPSRRSVDNMFMAWDRPFEDEFALCNLGQPSPYLNFAFPNCRSQYQEYFDMDNVPPEALNSWKRCFLRFLKQITLRNPKRVVLKSPSHTYRIKVLLDLFPNAQFVHIVRNPYVVFPSTVNAMKSLHRPFALQHPKFEGLESDVFDNFIHMYEKLEEVRPMLDSSRFYELRYEDLVEDPVGQLRAIYKNLKLGDFEQVLPKLKQYIVDTADYKTNSYKLSPELRDMITRRWGHIIRRYGYASDSNI